MRGSGFREISKALQRFAQSHREIVALYLFGSQAGGKSGPLSDLDVAVLIDEDRVRPDRFFKHQLELMGELMQACRRSDVDLILLNEATPLLACEAIRQGCLLFERNHTARVAFEARTIQRFLDLKPFYRVSRTYLKRQLLRTTVHG